MLVRTPFRCAGCFCSVVTDAGVAAKLFLPSVYGILLRLCLQLLICWQAYILCVLLYIVVSIVFAIVLVVILLCAAFACLLL